MCGIAGIFGKNKTGTGIEEIIDSIRHRGPDGKGYWKNENIALGHARLSIIDLSADGNQPMTDPGNGNVVAVNGEIYNFLEVREKLRTKYSFHTKSDTEVILAAYKVYGTDLFKELRGMFAFALYDSAKQKVLLARDRFGIKPLYYTKIGDAVFIASEIKGLLAIRGCPRKINELKAYEFLANRQLDCDKETMFEGIYQLMPGMYAWVSAMGEMENPQAYWQFPEPGDKKFEDKDREELVSVFEEAVRMHLRADVPVASFLSGGLDSSTVACLAGSCLTGKEFPVYSAVLPYFHPENSLIKLVLDAHANFIPRQFMLDGKDFFSEIPALIYHHDEPVMDGSMYAHYKLCQMAGKDGIKVLLSGAGGDELFGGYASHLHSHHAKLLRNLRLVKYFKQIKSAGAHSNWPVKELLLKSMYECLPVAIRKSIKNNQLRRRNPHLAMHPPVKHYYFRHKDPYYANLVNNYQSWTVPPYLHYEDRNSMAFGVEVRVPFYDHVLVEYFLQFGDDAVIKGSTKSVMRQSFKGIVPEPVLQQRGKYGFPSPIDASLQKDETGKALFYDHYLDTPFLIPGKAIKVANDFYSGKGDLNVYWRMLSFVIWHQVFFKNNDIHS